MSFADLFARMKLSQKDAEIIFDRDEPVGRTTDMVMPRRRWFRKKSQRHISHMSPMGPIRP